MTKLEEEFKNTQKKCATCKKRLENWYDSDCVVCKENFCSDHYYIIDKYVKDPNCYGRTRRKVAIICFNCAKKLKIIGKEK